MKATANICGVDVEIPEGGAAVTIWFDQGDTRVYVNGERRE